MRKLSRVLLAGVFVALLGVVAWAFPVIPHAGTEADPAIVYASPTSSVAFDDAYTSLGQTIVQADVQLLDVGGAIVATYEVTAVTLTNGVYKVPLRPHIEALPNGLYQIRVRLWDQYANSSEWSSTVFASKQWRAVSNPGGCRTLP